jgi:hypothetical protein
MNISAGLHNYTNNPLHIKRVLLWTRQLNFGLYKQRVISWLSDWLLDSQDLLNAVRASR